MRRSWFRVAAILLIALASTAFMASTAAAGQSNAPLGDAREACTSMANQDMHGFPDAPTEIIEAQYVVATKEAPAHCVVAGYVSPTIGFAVALPITGWNSKFLMMGCGGSCGSYSSALVYCNEALRRGYACAGTDQGHGGNLAIPSTKRLNDKLWAFNNPQAEIDHAGRATSAAALAAKELAHRFYSNADIRLSYFLGCSDGGRSAMIMAQHYPFQFDGIIAIDPVMKWSKSLLQMEYNYQAVTHADGTPVFKRVDLEVLHKAVMDRCDKLDGLVDGVIGDPRLCKFDPASVECAAGATAACLTHDQVIAVRKVYAGLRTSDGKQVFYGAMLGSELSDPYAFSAQPEDRMSGYQRYLLYSPDRPTWTRDQIAPDSDYKRIGVARTLYDADNPDLRDFKSHGGKLIISQAWDDSGLPSPRSNIDYYETMERVMGGPENTLDFARLFTFPGRAHCGRGSGANMVDYIDYLEKWVEKGQAPDMLLASHLENPTAHSAEFARAPRAGDNITFTRPIYPYPTQFRYKGKGDPNDYRSFEPVKPAPAPPLRLN